MAENRRWHGPCFVNGMWRRIGRLFTIKTRLEAFLVTYAIALGAVERGKHYLATYPGVGVVFIAGAKLLDSVRPPATAEPAPAESAPTSYS